MYHPRRRAGLDGPDTQEVLHLPRRRARDLSPRSNERPPRLPLLDRRKKRPHTNASSCPSKCQTAHPAPSNSQSERTNTAATSTYRRSTPPAPSTTMRSSSPTKIARMGYPREFPRAQNPIRHALGASMAVRYMLPLRMPTLTTTRPDPVNRRTRRVRQPEHHRAGPARPETRSGETPSSLVDGSLARNREFVL
jgi:hypothetical protein